jgi:NAD(P)-dependent dehydrogenase (short-subunit alcohol dehydrogenase family)
VHSGEAIVRRLADEGFSVCINDIEASHQEAETLAAELRSKHGNEKAIAILADVTDASQVIQMIKDATTKLGPLTVMIANAGIAHVCPVLDLTEKDVQNMLNVNFVGVFNCYTHAARKMIAQGPRKTGDLGYRILGASSIAAFKPFPALSHYCATKAAVRAFTQTFAIEMARHQITVNAYAPGIVGTKMWDLVDEKLGQLEGRARGETIKQYSTNLTALGRVSAPEDVSKVVGGFLCSADSDFVTGQTVIVDGGIVFS